VFTMTIRSVGETVIKSGKSQPGQDREDSLHRLDHETLPPHGPRRRVVFMTDHGFEILSGLPAGEGELFRPACLNRVPNGESPHSGALATTIRET
jgi:hypothetical protein